MKNFVLALCAVAFCLMVIPEVEAGCRGRRVRRCKTQKTQCSSSRCFTPVRTVAHGVGSVFVGRCNSSSDCQNGKCTVPGTAPAPAPAPILDAPAPEVDEAPAVEDAPPQE